MILSTDSGVSWSLADSGLPATNIENLVVLGNDLFAATYKSGLFRSTNNGGNWEPVITGFAAGVSIVTVSVTGANLFVAGQPYGVLLSTDSGASWWPMNKGFPITNVNALASIGANVSVGTSGGGFHSSDAGTNWQPSSLADKVNMFWSNDNTLYAGTDASLQFSTDSGKTWRGAGLDAGVRSITFAGQNLVIGTNAGVQISNDTGFTWGSVGNILSDTAVNALLTLDTVIFAGIDGTVFRSTDLGVGWTPSGNGLQGSNVKALVAMSNGPAEIIFAGTFGRGVFVSNDSGRSWSSANVGLTDDSVYTLLVDGPYLFAGTTGGVYLLVPDGKGWSPESSGLTNLDVRALAYDNSYLYAGTTGNGVWRRPLSEMISQSVKSQAASFKHDIVSYPNPFTQSTKISFISDGGYASVSIVNLLGQEVAQLSSGELPRGEHSFTWNSTGLPAGTYTCVVRSSGGVERLPLMLIR
jgi:ligand-binding sensor domain-containing protein